MAVGQAYTEAIALGEGLRYGADSRDLHGGLGSVMESSELR